MKGLICVLLLAGFACAQIPQSKHIWLVAEENHSYEEVIGNSDMPYFNSLAKTYGLASQYYSVQHNSLSALMWLVAGQKVTDDDNAQGCFDVDNIVRHLLSQQMTWKAYEEDLPYAGFQGLSYHEYVRRHNPLIDFTDSCIDQQKINSVPFGQLATDMQTGNTPNYAYITPNLLDDAHDGTLQQADQWLAQQIPPILSLPEFQPGGDGLIFVVFDEGELGGQPDDRCASNIPTGCGGRIATLVIGPQVRPGYQSTMLYSHYNLLATACAAMQMHGCPDAGALASPMTDFFNTVTINTPFDGAAVASPVHIQATTNNQSEVYAMQIYVDDKLQYHTNGNSVDTSLPMSEGRHYVVVQSWDSDGGIHKRGIEVNVQSEAVVVTSPARRQVVSSPVSINASAGGEYPVNSMQVYVDDVLQYQAQGSQVNAQLPMDVGRHHVVVQALDSSHRATKTGFYITAAQASVTIKSPKANANVYSPIPLRGTTQNPSQVYAVQAYVDDQLVYQYTGTGIKAVVPLPVGQHHLVLQSWDEAKEIYKSDEDITVIPVVVTIETPTNNAQVSSPVTIQGSVPKSAPVYLMQVYVDDRLEYQVSGKDVNTQLAMTSGQHHIVVQAWDEGGGVWKSGVYVTVVQ
jgi:acid phosphatase